MLSRKIIMSDNFYDKDEAASEFPEAIEELVPVDTTPILLEDEYSEMKFSSDELTGLNKSIDKLGVVMHKWRVDELIVVEIITLEKTKNNFEMLLANIGYKDGKKWNARKEKILLFSSLRTQLLKFMKTIESGKGAKFMIVYKGKVPSIKYPTKEAHSVIVDCIFVPPKARVAEKKPIRKVIKK